VEEKDAIEAEDDNDVADDSGDDDDLEEAIHETNWSLRNSNNLQHAVNVLFSNSK